MATGKGIGKGRKALQIEIEGLKKVKHNISSYGDNVLDNVFAASEMTQARVTNRARKIVPVKTGALQNSIGPGRIWVTNTKIQAEIIAAMEYAKTVEKRKPYLAPSIYSNAGYFNKQVALAIKKAYP